MLIASQFLLVINNIELHVFHLKTSSFYTLTNSMKSKKPILFNTNFFHNTAKKKCVLGKQLQTKVPVQYLQLKVHVAKLQR